MRPDASENGQINPSTIVRAARAAGSHPHLASVLQQGRKRSNICVSLRVIRGIPAKMTDTDELRRRRDAAFGKICNQVAFERGLPVTRAELEAEATALIRTYLKIA
jgi:hypothetical protein